MIVEITDDSAPYIEPEVYECVMTILSGKGTLSERGKLMNIIKRFEFISCSEQNIYDEMDCFGMDGVKMITIRPIHSGLQFRIEILHLYRNESAKTIAEYVIGQQFMDDVFGDIRVNNNIHNDTVILRWKPKE